MTFFIGILEPAWLDFIGVPAMVSANRLRIRTVVPSKVPWALDSGAFTQLRDFGQFVVGSEQYASEAQGWCKILGQPVFASIQDWMCEAPILHMTGLSIREHQQRTIQSYLDLTRLAPEVPWIPILQGWTFDDYLLHIKRYTAAGVDLFRSRLVGLGSVCKRQNTRLAEELIRELCLARGYCVHAFGLKLSGLRRVHTCLSSSDSMAWSYAARKRKLKLKTCEHDAPTCKDCSRWALLWRKREVLTALETPCHWDRQLFE